LGAGFVSVSGSHIDSKNVTTGQPLVTSIPDRVSTTLGLRFLDQRLTIGARVAFVAPSGVTSENTSSAAFSATKGYGLLDLFGSYKLNESVSADLYLKNVFNQEYTQYLNTLPSAGFSAKASLTVKFASM
jgi:hemoglobin/transferrin/lactoferrin receptor protein